MNKGFPSSNNATRNNPTPDHGHDQLNPVKQPMPTWLFADTTPLSDPTDDVSYNFLLVPLMAKSHVYTMIAIADELIARGHRATILLRENFPVTSSELRNRSDIRLARIRSSNPRERKVEEVFDEMTMALMKQRTDDSFFWRLIGDFVGCDDDNCGWLQRLAVMFVDQCRELTMDNDDLLAQLDKERFNLAIIDGGIWVKYFSLIPHRLHVPWINVGVTIDPLNVRVPWLPSHVPCVGTPLSERMTFLERLQNLVIYLIIRPIYNRLPEDIHEAYQKYGQFSDLNELASRSLLYLLTQDVILDYPRPMMPSMVNIGGLTVREPSGELSGDLKQFVDGAPKGVILASFGTTACKFPRHVVEKFASAFSRLDGYRLVWRLDNVDNVSLPQNVMGVRWLPQNDLLGHPSVRLFITHCGNNGQFESVYHGVPMIGFPMLSDQLFNARRIVYRGYGRSMNIAAFSSDELLDNIRTILDDPSYAARVRKASEIYRSRPESPAQRAAFWIEHVSRFGGDHLRSAGNDLSLLSYWMLDILAFLCALGCVFIVALLTATRCLMRKLCRKNIRKEKSG